MPPPRIPDTYTDAFLGFIDHARTMLWPDDDLEDPDESPRPPWSWIVSRVLRTCAAYPSGVTTAILLSDLSQAWGEQQRYAMSKRRLDVPAPSITRRNRRKRLPNTITIDSIYEKNFLSPSSVLEVFVVQAFLLPDERNFLSILHSKSQSIDVSVS